LGPEFFVAFLVLYAIAGCGMACSAGKFLQSLLWPAICWCWFGGLFASGAAACPCSGHEDAGGTRIESPVLQNKLAPSQIFWLRRGACGLRLTGRPGFQHHKSEALITAVLAEFFPDLYPTGWPRPRVFAARGAIALQAPKSHGPNSGRYTDVRSSVAPLRSDETNRRSPTRLCCLP